MQGVAPPALPLREPQQGLQAAAAAENGHSAELTPLGAADAAADAAMQELLLQVTRWEISQSATCFTDT